MDLNSPGKDDRARNQVEAVATKKQSPSISEVSMIHGYRIGNV